MASVGTMQDILAAPTAPTARTPPTDLLAPSDPGPRCPMLAYLEGLSNCVQETLKQEAECGEMIYGFFEGEMGTEYSVLVKNSRAVSCLYCV